MTSYLVEFPLRRYRRVQGLPPDFPPIVGEIPMEATSQGATADSHVGENPVVEAWE